MKYIFTLLFFFTLSISQSQELKTLELLPPNSTKTDDLSVLKTELQNKQLVMLGELTHMFGNIFEMKARVVEYLHQELGFTTIAMESSMYDIWKMNTNGFNNEAFNDAIWGVWSGSEEFQRLVNYIEKNNLKVIGFDSQVNNTAQFAEDFFDYCKQQNIPLKLNKDDLYIVIEGVLENTTIVEDDITYSAYEKELNNVIKNIEKLEQNDTNYHWLQFTKSLLACSLDAQQNTTTILSTSLIDKDHNIRDKQMADNLLSYMSKHPTEKIVCWADNIHIINNSSSLEQPIAKAFVSMGTHIKNQLQDKVYSLATIHANDSLLDLGTKIWHKTPVQQNSFEGELNSINKPYLFVSSKQEAMQKEQTTRLLDFINFSEVRLDQLHDGYIFIKQANLPKGEAEGVRTSKNNQDALNKIKQIVSGNNVVLKGKIIDKETNISIPFANVILKEQEIYRVADDNGFFKLSVKPKLLDNVMVEISSMGYQEVSIPLNDLKNNIYLNPKYEDLDAVVVTGYLSPETVLKKAILSKEDNHPTQPFNLYRYGKVILNKNDVTELDLELFTKDYDQGYQTKFVITQSVEQIKWNKNTVPDKYKYSSQFFHYRQNGVRYANILHKRKYKKFNLKFVKSSDPNYSDAYVIAFKTDRDKWSYTNRGYPTQYSGRVYISKDNFAILKVIENWETTLNAEEIKEYANTNEENDIKESTIKEENISYYADVFNNGRYYATRFFNRMYTENITSDNALTNAMMQRDSYMFDFETKDVENIKYEHYEYQKKRTILNRVDYDKAFWDAFYKRNIGDN